jgi:hypothetical protein
MNDVWAACDAVPDESEGDYLKRTADDEQRSAESPARALRREDTLDDNERGAGRGASGSRG